MKLAIILANLLSTFAIPVPNLCDEVYLDASGAPVTDLVGQTLSVYCQWTGPNAPVWDANVCCTLDDDVAQCSVTDTNGRCSSGTKMYCEYADALPGGDVVCYQPLPGMCDAGLCIDAPEIPPVGVKSEYIACCGEGGACQWIPYGSTMDCQGQILACDYGILNEDGTLECWS